MATREPESDKRGETVKTFHRITLDEPLASLWREVAEGCGLLVASWGGAIVTKGEEEDIEIAWQLYREEWKRVMGGDK